MKILFIGIFTFIFFNTYLFAELQDCSQFKKLSKDYLKCTKDNLKFKSDEAGVTQKANDFKESETLLDFLNKDKKVTEKENQTIKENKEIDWKKSTENFKSSKTIEEFIKKNKQK